MGALCVCKKNNLCIPYIFPLSHLQPAFEHVRMKGCWMKEPVHVTVQVVSVGLTVKVSAL